MLSPAYNGARRPNRSDAGPYNQGPTAKPKKNDVTNHPTRPSSAAMAKSARISAKVGIIKSMAMAVSAIMEVTMATNSRRPAVDRWSEAGVATDVIEVNPR
jgi:hypothetical protein